MIKLKEIRLFPSVWYLDVYVIENKDDAPFLHEILSRRHGNPPKFYKKHTDIDATHLLESTIESELAETRVVVIYDGDIITLVHELLHVIWYFGNCTGAKITKETQEWQALLYEYLYSECTSKEGWREVS